MTPEPTDSSRDVEAHGREALTYDAFISYRTTLTPDRPVGEALQTLCEQFPVPRSLAHRIVAPGRFRSRLKVFRDTTDMSAAADLGAAIRRKLQTSRWLILVCTPNTRLSNYCLEELRQFIEYHGRHRVLYLLADGEPEESLPTPSVITRATGTKTDTRPSDGPSSPAPTVIDIPAHDLPGILRQLNGVGVAAAARARFALLAPLLGCESPGDLVRHHRARIRRQAALASGLLLIALVSIGYFVETWRHREQVRADAQSILDVIDGQTDAPSTAEYAALEQLADGTPELRAAAIRQVLSSGELASRVRHRLPYVVHAVVGLNRDMRATVRSIVEREAEHPAEDVSVNVARADVGVLLDYDEAPFNNLVATHYRLALDKSSDPAALVILGRTLGALGRRLPPEHAAAAARHFAGSLRALVSTGYDPHPEKPNVNPRIFDATKGTDLLVELGAALESVSGRLPVDEWTGLSSTLATTIRQAGDLDTLRTLCHVVLALASSVSTPGAAEIAGAIVDRMRTIEKRRERTGFAFVAMGDALVWLGDKLPADQASAALTELLVMRDKEGSPPWQESLDEVIARLCKQITGPQAGRSALDVTGGLGKLSAGEFEVRGVVLRELQDDLAEHEAAAITAGLEQYIQVANEPARVGQLMEVALEIAVRLPVSRAAAVAEHLVTALEKGRIEADGSRFDTAFATLAARLPESTVRALERRTAAVRQSKTSRTGESIRDVILGVLRRQLPAATALEASRRLLATIETRLPVADAEPPSDVDRIVEQLRAECDRLPIGEKSTLVRELRAVSRRYPKVLPLATLSASLTSLVNANMSASEAAQAAHRIAANMSDRKDVSTLSDLIALGDRVPAEAAVAALRKALRIGEDATFRGLDVSPGELVRLKNFPRDEAIDTLVRLATAMQDARRDLGVRDAAVSIAAALEPLEASVAARKIIEAAADRNGLWLANVITPLADKMSPADAREVAERLWALVSNTDNSFAFAHRSLALSVVAHHLSADRAVAAADEMVDRLPRTKDSDHVAVLAVSLGDMARNIGPELTFAAFKQILSTMMDTYAFERTLETMGSGLMSLAKHLPAAQGVEASALLFAAAENARDTQRRLVKEILKGVVARLPVRERMRVLASVACVGSVRERILAGLPNEAAPNTETSLWDAVTIAEGHGVDLREVRRVRLVPAGSTTMK